MNYSGILYHFAEFAFSNQIQSTRHAFKMSLELLESLNEERLLREGGEDKLKFKRYAVLRILKLY